MTHKNKLLTKAQELEAQVKQLEQTPPPAQTNQFTQGTSLTSINQQQRKRKLESENIEPKDKESKNLLSANITSALTDHQDYMKANVGTTEDKAKMFATENSVMKGQLMENSSNLSIRKLLENTRTEKTSVPSEIGVKELNVKQNGIVKIPMTMKCSNDLTQTKPSLPISIPLECLPGENVKDAMERVILQGLKSNSNSRNSSASPVSRPNSQSNNTDNSNVNTDSANKDHLGPVLKSEPSATKNTSGQQQAAWTSANFVPNDQSVSENKTSFSIDKLVLNKRKGLIFNGERKQADNLTSENSANVSSGQTQPRTSQGTINTSNTLDQSKTSGNQVKRKYDGGSDTASKRLFGLPNNSSSSPQSRPTTAMLISTANQPLQISAIPSPDIQGKLSAFIESKLALVELVTQF